MNNKKFYQKAWFLWVCGLFIPVVGIILLWTVHKDKSKGFKIGITLLLIIWSILSFALYPIDSKEDGDTIVEENQTISSDFSIQAAEEETTAQDQTSEVASVEAISDSTTVAREEFDKQFSDGTVIFDQVIRNDKTGKWRMYRVTSSKNIVDYAVDYYKAYFSADDELHWVINFHPQQKSTTAIRVLDDMILDITIHEYIEDEEHDANELGGGDVIAEYYIDIETGKQLSDEADECVGTVSNDELIEAVKEAIEGEIGQGEKITDVSFDGENLTVKVDLSGADTTHLTQELIAESRASSITDGILQLEDKYFNTWNTMTIDFGNIGSISFDKSDVKDGGLGRYVDVPVAYFE